MNVATEKGEWLFSHRALVDHQRGESRTGLFSWVTHLPTVPDSAARLEFGLYDPHWRRLALDSSRVRIYLVEP